MAMLYINKTFDKKSYGWIIVKWTIEKIRLRGRGEGKDMLPYIGNKFLRI